MTGVTKRTIDYYTNFGLLKAERSTSNYRYYSSEAIERIHKIEQMKSQGLCLQKIKKALENDVAEFEEIDLQEIRLHMQKLQSEVSSLVVQLKQQEQSTQQSVKNKVSTESVALMQTLLLLIP